MKTLLLGAIGIGGTIGFFAFGKAPPDDFIRTVAKPPQAVYAAFASLGSEGETVIPTRTGGRIVQRVRRDENQRIEFELLLDSDRLLTAELEFTPDGEGTRIAGELDLNTRLITQTLGQGGAQTANLPASLLSDDLVDYAFAEAMKDVADRIESGQGLPSLASVGTGFGAHAR